MKFSIIVPTYNEENDITETLESIVALDYHDFEVFMVDDSTDSTPDIILQYKDRGIQLVKPGGGGRCEARNKGIELATGEVVVILNADVQLPKDFLNNIKKYYDAGFDLVSVRSKVLNDERLFPRYLDCVNLRDEATNPKDDRLLWTEGFSCRRELAFKAGLFPAGFPIAMYAGEDGFFAANLVKVGAKKHFAYEIVVTHIAPASFKENWAIRTSRGRACSQYRRYIDRWPMWKIAGWNFLKMGFNGLKTVTFIQPLYYCWMLTPFSKKGRKDWLPLYYAHTLETIAMTYGLWKEMIVIYMKEQKRLSANGSDSVPS
ncbi:MAG: glycosyltransferase family 2 protein [Gammaproteobacteria bacterium]|nr:glycosyltransferase family 2 protein [Gammaproteobacteria bacterium]